MKKLYILLVAVMVTALSFGQGPIITMIADGDCAGGNPRVVEIYANGTVDFTMYSFQKQSNGGAWGTDLDLSLLGTRTDEFVYVYRESATGVGTFAADFPSVVTASTLSTEDVMAGISTLNINGDDGIRIIETASIAVIDQFAPNGVDGTGESWEYKDGYIKRNNSIGANAGAFVAANWTAANGALNGFGVCQGGATFESIIGLATYTPPTGNDPASLVIASPSEGSTEADGDVTVTYAINNFVVAPTDGTGDGHFHYMLTGPTAIASTPVFANTGSLDLAGLMPGAYTLFMDLRDDAHASLTPAVEATVNFTVQSYTQVADIAALRAGTVGDAYELTGEALINYEQSFRHQKWIQDATAGILIDDSPGNITAGVRGDGLSGIKGTLGEYQGMLQFNPVADATLVSPSTVTVTPEEVTFADLIANPNDYEAELVKVIDVILADYDDAGAGTADGTFQNGKQYPMTQGSDMLDFRTNFYGVDYTGTAFPTIAQDIVGLIGERSSGYFLSARDLADIMNTTATVSENTIDGFSMYPNPVSNGVFTIDTAQNLEKNIAIFSILGKQVINTTITGNTVNVAHLNAGIYLVKVIEAGNTVTRKLVIK